MTKPQRLKNATIYTSEVATVDKTLTIGAPGADTIDPSSPFCFAGVEFFSKAEPLEENWVTPTAGTATFEVTTRVNPQFTDAILMQSIDATAPETASWEAPTKSVSVTGSGVVGATHWRLILWVSEQ